MLFQPGHKLAKGGARPGAGRPPKGQKSAAQIIKDILDANAAKLGNRFIDRALGQMGDKVLCEAINKLLPNEQTSQPTSITINYVRFDNTVAVSPPQLPVTILEGDAVREEPSRASLAPPSGQGQNGLKFHDFKDVS